MASHIELEISRLLFLYKDSQKVSQVLYERFKKHSHSFEDKVSAVQFLIQTRNFEPAFKLFSKWLKKQQEIPWGEFLELLSLCKHKMNNEIFNEVFNGATEQEQLESLVSFWGYDKKDERIANLRAQLNIERKQKVSEKQQELHDKLVYLKSNRMILEEKKTLEKLELMFPNDNQLPTLKEEFKLRWAHYIIAENRLQNKERNLFNKSRYELTEDERQLKSVILKFMLKDIKKHPEKAYDFMIGLFFMELYEAALELMASAKPTIAMKWLRVDLLLLCNRYIEALDAINEIELIFQENPETQFSSVYLKAQCLWGLGQKTEALDLMSSLVNVRPTYRSAHALLNEWQGISL